MSWQKVRSGEIARVIGDIGAITQRPGGRLCGGQHKGRAGEVRSRDGDRDGRESGRMPDPQKIRGYSEQHRGDHRQRGAESMDELIADERNYRGQTGKQYEGSERADRQD